MSASVKLTGFEEFRAELRNLTPHLAQEAGTIVVGHANHAAEAIRAGYGRKTGELRKGVKVDKVVVSAAGASARVRSTGRLAYIYENGTEVKRKWANGKNTGKMPPSHIVAQTAVRERRVMQEDLIALVERNGLKVEGHG